MRHVISKKAALLNNELAIGSSKLNNTIIHHHFGEYMLTITVTVTVTVIVTVIQIIIV